MKVKKIVKRLRKLSTEYHFTAVSYDGESKDVERLYTIAEVLRLLADEMAPGSASKRKKEKKNKTAKVAIKAKDGTIMGWKKGQDLPGKAAD